MMPAAPTFVNAAPDWIKYSIEIACIAKKYGETMVSAKSFPNLTGVWKLNMEKSVLHGPAPKEMLVKIEHRGEALVQHILVTNAEGAEQRLTFKFGTDAETTNSVNGITTRTRARWDGMELVIESWMKTPARELHVKDHWSLSRDGQTLTMAHRDDDLAGQISVLEKASPVEAAKFEGA